MSTDVLFQVLATVVGLILTALTFVHGSAQSRGKNLYERSVQFLDLHERFRQLGPATGQLASTASSTAHDRQLAEFEREARVSAILYASAVSRLRNPGSFVVGFFCLAYAVITALITGSVVVQVLDAGPIATVVLAGPPAIVTATLTISGARLVLRRHQTFQIRGLMGEVDPLSAEGVRRFSVEQISFWRSLFKHSERPSPSIGSSSSES